jgi:hypothetical protein
MRIVGFLLGFDPKVQLSLLHAGEMAPGLAARNALPPHSPNAEEHPPELYERPLIARQPI